MAIITLATVAAHISDITEEQIATATRIIDMETMHPYYLVQSSQDDLVEYRVDYSETRGFSCTCPSGLYGFWNVRHPSGVCRHCRIAVAASEDFKELLKAEAEAQARIAQQTVKAPVTARQALCNAVGVSYASSNVDDETLARIARRDAERKARDKKPSRKVAYCQTRPAGFSLLKK
jgi:hypothetical protein